MLKREGIDYKQLLPAFRVLAGGGTLQEAKDAMGKGKEEEEESEYYPEKSEGEETEEQLFLGDYYRQELSALISEPNQSTETLKLRMMFLLSNLVGNYGNESFLSNDNLKQVLIEIGIYDAGDNIFTMQIRPLSDKQSISDYGEYAKIAMDTLVKLWVEEKDVQTIINSYYQRRNKIVQPPQFKLSKPAHARLEDVIAFLGEQTKKTDFKGNVWVETVNNKVVSQLRLILKAIENNEANLSSAQKSVIDDLKTRKVLQDWKAFTMSSKLIKKDEEKFFYVPRDGPKKPFKADEARKGLNMLLDASKKIKEQF